MKISHGARLSNFSTRNGYGYVTDRVLENLYLLGHEVKPNDDTAPVQLWYDQPHHIEWGKNPYRIAYHPWESTELKTGWLNILNEANEVWATSPLLADWYREMGVTRPVHTYLHGVDPVWAPEARQISDRIRFLHVGGEALRKGASELLDAFRVAFHDKDDVELTLKMMSKGLNITRVGKVNIINDSLPLADLIRLYHSHQVFVYPSWGEGFGLNPLQAMATGMPTICTAAWAPYANYLDPALALDSKLVESPWPLSHPGKMFQPNFDDLVDKLRFVYDHYDLCAAMAMAQAPQMHQDFNWLSLTKNAFESLENRLGKIA